MRNDFEHQQEWWCPYSQEQHGGDYECVIYNIPKKCDGKPGLYELCEHWRSQTDVDLEEEAVMTKKSSEMSIKECVEYLDWYFYADNGTADKHAMKAYATLKHVIPASMI